MISIHSDRNWLAPFIPKRFKIRSVDELTDTSTGTIAAVNLERTLPDSFDRILNVVQRYRHVIVYICEPWCGYGDSDLLTKILRDLPSVVVFTDIIMDQELPNHKQVSNWFCEHENIYTLPWTKNILEELRQDCIEKQYTFDALLGVQRPHRDLIYHYWHNSDHQDKILLTYFRDDPRNGIWDVPYTVTGVKDQTVLSLMNYTLATAVAQDTEDAKSIETYMILPVTIYNNSWYSIIAEGFTDHRGTRLTEKTAKALVAERLFVMFGAPRDLERMRRLGFQTFDGIIDESYDNIKDDKTRWQTAWQQVEWLCQQDPVRIQAASRDIRKHNRHVFLETDWYANLKQHLGHAVDLLG